MISNFVKYAKNRVEKRMRYGRLVAEIQSLTPRDLADIGADRGEMLRHPYLDVNGQKSNLGRLRAGRANVSRLLYVRSGPRPNACDPMLK